MLLATFTGPTEVRVGIYANDIRLNRERKVIYKYMIDSLAFILFIRVKKIVQQLKPS